MIDQTTLTVKYQYIWKLEYCGVVTEIEIRCGGRVFGTVSCTHICKESEFMIDKIMGCKQS